MISGASRAEAALLVIDAAEGIKENSRRHGYMLSMLGISQVAVVVNKMDLVDYDQVTFENIKNDYTIFLKDINIYAKYFIPVSGRTGENITFQNEKMPWYNGEKLIEILDGFEKENILAEKPFRMPLQDIYKFTNGEDDRRIIAGYIESGNVKTGDELIFFPSGKRSRIKTIEAFNKNVQTKASAGVSTGFTLEEQIYVLRGEMAAKSTETSPHISENLKVSLFWLGKNPLTFDKEYILKIGTAKVSMKLNKIIRTINAMDLTTLTEQKSIHRHDVAECLLNCGSPIAFDTADNISATSRFVIIDDYEIAGGGIILEAVNDKYSWVREKVTLRNYKWERSNLSVKERAGKYNQKSFMILFSGNNVAPKKEIAKQLEAKLFSNGKFVYFLGIGSLLYGVDADIKSNGSHRKEHLRRLAEVSHLMLDAGLILIITTTDIKNDDLEILKTIVDPDKISTIWVGDNVPGDFVPDLHLTDVQETESTADLIIQTLAEKGIIFKPY